MADVVLAASRARSSAHVAIEGEKRRAIPDLLEAVLMQIASLEFRGLEESAGIHFTFGTDAAGGCRGSAHIKSGEFIAKGVEMEK